MRVYSLTGMTFAAARAAYAVLQYPDCFVTHKTDIFYHRALLNSLGYEYTNSTSTYDTEHLPCELVFVNTVIPCTSEASTSKPAPLTFEEKIEIVNQSTDYLLRGQHDDIKTLCPYMMHMWYKKTKIPSEKEVQTFVSYHTTCTYIYTRT
jgi:hypothetical protein